ELIQRLFFVPSSDLLEATIIAGGSVVSDYVFIPHPPPARDQRSISIVEKLDARVVLISVPGYHEPCSRSDAGGHTSPWFLSAIGPGSARARGALQGDARCCTHERCDAAPERTTASRWLAIRQGQRRMDSRAVQVVRLGRPH